MRAIKAKGYLLGIDEVPVLNARLETFDPKHASGICLDPARMESAKRLGVGERWLSIPTRPLVEIQRLNIGHSRWVPD